MLQRCTLPVLVAIGLAASSGCCLVKGVAGVHDFWLERYQRTHWMCGECGEFYWSEWYNDPPACCDPCDRGGKFVGPQSCKRAIPPRQRSNVYQLLTEHAANYYGAGLPEPEDDLLDGGYAEGELVDDAMGSDVPPVRQQDAPPLYTGEEVYGDGPSLPQSSKGPRARR